MEIKSKEWEEIYEDEREIEILTAKKKALTGLYEKIYGKKLNLSSIEGDLRKEAILAESQVSSRSGDSKE